MSLANGPVIAAQKRGHTTETSMQYSYRKILDFAIDEKDRCGVCGNPLQVQQECCGKTSPAERLVAMANLPLR